MRMLVGPALIFAACAAAYGQSTDSTFTFEVASVKPAPPPDGRGMFVRVRGGPGTKDPEHYIVENDNLNGLVSTAYDLMPYELSSPDWMREARFNLTANVPAGATKEQFRVMMKNLLAERFGLKVHRESKEMGIYELVVGKGGAKLKPSDPPPAADADQPPRNDGPPKFALGPEGFPLLPPGNTSMMVMMAGKNGPVAAKRARRETIEELTRSLSFQLGKPVKDGTGLKGTYDYDLYWAAGQGRAAAVASSAETGPAPADDAAGPSLLEAVQQQLGLRLESKKGSIEVVVVERCNHAPSEN